MTEHTELPWVAIEGDTFNPGRPWGVSRYLSKEDCEEIDGDDATWPSRTEVIAEIMPGPPGLAEADAKFIARACNAHDDLLAACKASQNWMREYVTQHCVDDPLADGEVSLFNQLTAAIAKAEGK